MDRKPERVRFVDNDSVRIVGCLFSVGTDDIRRHGIYIRGVHTVGIRTHLYNYCVDAVLFNVCEYLFYVSGELSGAAL